MKQKIHKIIFLIFVLVTSLFVAALYSDRPDFLAEQGTTISPEAPLLKVYFFDVGQGDAIYVRTPAGQDILIDGGPDKKVLNELGRVMPFWDREIDVVVLTHPHSDHVTGLVEVLRRYRVKHVYYTGALHTAPDYLAWLGEIKKQNLDLKIVQDFFEMEFSPELKLQFLYPQKNLVNRKMEELNNSSIVSRLVYQDASFLFMGDATEEVEFELLLDENVDLTADVLKVGHHGSASSSSEEFLAKVQPAFAVIQVGQENAFGHPHLKILKRLERSGVKILRTDESGAIQCLSDGKSINCQ